MKYPEAAGIQELQVDDDEDDEWEWSETFTVPTPRLLPHEVS